MRLLVVEDNTELSKQLRTALAEAGFAVDSAADGEEGLHLGATEPYDAVVLDLGLPRLDGLSVLRRWRAADRAMPVILLTARDSWAEKVEGLNAGADDYLAKPFSSRELLARVNAQGRRRLGRLKPDPVLQMGDIEVNRTLRIASQKGRALNLTKLEFDLLVAFVERPARTLGREVLVELLHRANDEVFDRAVDVLVSRLRAKLDDDGTLILTVRGVGYMFAPRVAP